MSVKQVEAMDYIAGYCLHNDVSERACQFRNGEYMDKGKGCDTFAPLGPFMPTEDEIRNVNNLGLWISVDGT